MVRMFAAMVAHNLTDNGSAKWPWPHICFEVRAASHVWNI